VLCDGSPKGAHRAREEGGVGKTSKRKRPRKARPARGAPTPAHRSADREARLRAFNLDARAAAGGMIDLAELRLVIPRHRVWFYRNERAGRFPKRRRIGPGAIVWSAREVLDFLRAAPQGPAAQHEQLKHRAANDTATA
jgi:predicted DNA-binding transcriptional regulator AlpA